MQKKAKDIFRSCGGQLRMSEAIRCGISRYMLYTLRDKGIIEQVSRGVYRLAELPPVSNPDLVTVALRYPNAVICLVSALAYHEITTQIPHSVSVAVARESRLPSLDYPPITVHRFSAQAFHAGIEEHQIDGATVRIYSPEKTLADCFKFRNQLGMDVVLEALKLYKSRRKFNIEALLKYAKICRVENVMRPYLEVSV
ncbi:MAG TPA: type IV toxin-antitoxin system AbiEi family antitoxin domain-containing protein [Myxococcota bacterium]|nr:type IV toxin-antitoxin system AbiEi family antitoxin domain-containing protein [Myxococcota bacterium]HOS62779.1 type IV toxin-antitoxin system AbiEi family antitoxin domain-containing protein [Myxococcota bacterium]HPC92578.1 type IV toxin-antitoxin system AbiEi family antitoxin domain-containing protein [Myxococcota bacterium]HPL26075.1 type IV toxin-antitoxin system AbiEi family antitoxin domain-containing protein [Myxococcota bacterium]